MNRDQRKYFQRNKSFLKYDLLTNIKNYIIILAIICFLEFFDFISKIQFLKLSIFLLFIAIIDSWLVFRRALKIGYTISSSTFIIEKHLFFRRDTEVYLTKVYAIEKKNNPVLKKFGMTNLVVLTSGRSFRIKGLSSGDADIFYDLIMKVKNAENI